MSSFNYIVSYQLNCNGNYRPCFFRTCSEPLAKEYIKSISDNPKVSDIQLELPR